MATGSKSSTLSCVQEIFNNFSGRRAGLIRALTQDVDTFFQICHPDKDSLCLFGYPDESWKVTPPTEKVPSMLPEPTLGINYARDSMDPRDWLLMVAIHCDSWLLAVAFFYGGRSELDQTQRKQLFTMINNLPHVHEVVRDWQNAKDKPKKGKSHEASGSKSSCRTRSSVKRLSDEQSKSTQNIEQSQVENKEYKGTHCGNCGGLYNGDEFWMLCGICRLWYHGRCVGITPTMAESIENYECPLCYMKHNTSVPETD
ncbi:hypothetical protein E3N88_32169 [Mikania micrantha]|uniref:PHD finger protein ALFIN-LIKE n=1 Tax=Mikania micrantha TaxID=192012 RepID=A0A5N6M7R7_9ASTR|nr:hypothetical protein E3N88_32169 [Mikania micrantha]